MWQWSLLQKFHSQLKLIQNNKYTERKRKWKYDVYTIQVFNHFARNSCSERARGEYVLSVINTFLSVYSMNAFIYTRTMKNGKVSSGGLGTKGTPKGRKKWKAEAGTSHSDLTCWSNGATTNGFVFVWLLYRKSIAYNSRQTLSDCIWY